ncbi:MAG TPA: hypothetical protein VLE96_02600 [Chlamydiales bacterium]|nr:hypothetical protein [Chlamydiales bacterium]
MVLSTQPHAYLSTYASDYSWPKKISPPPNTSHGTLARECIFPVQLRPKIETSPIMFNPFLNTNEDGWMFECTKKKVKIALADYGSRVIKATIGGGCIDPNLIFLQQPEGDKPVANLATGEFLRHLRLISRGEESLEIERRGSQQNVIITSKPDASKKCSLTHYGPTERAKLAQQRSKTFPIIPVSYALSSRKQIRQPRHPSSNPENKFRDELHCEFFTVMPLVLDQLGCKKNAEEDYLPVWVIFCGVGGANKQFFCHITEDNATSNVYNSCDPDTPEMPVIVYGQPAFIPKAKIKAFQEGIPIHHQTLPVQAAYAVSSSGLPTPILPSGSKSLRFDATPIQYWSHKSRPQVIHTALGELQERDKHNTLTTEDREKINLYSQFQTLEKKKEQLQGIRQRHQRDSKKELQARSKADRGEKYKDAIPRWQRLLKDKEPKIAAEQQANKEANRSTLPHSYTSPTFQFSFGSKESFYKRLSDGGILLSDPNSTGGIIDNRNDVHIPYVK